jgi:hypothetical protein
MGSLIPTQALWPMYPGRCRQMIFKDCSRHFFRHSATFLHLEPQPDLTKTGAFAMNDDGRQKALKEK